MTSRHRYSVKNIVSRAAVVLLLALFFVVPESVIAQSIDGPAVQDFGVSQFEDTIELGGTDIRVIIAQIISIFLGLLGIIATVIFLYAGYLWMTSGGDETKISNAKKTMIKS